MGRHGGFLAQHLSGDRTKKTRVPTRRLGSLTADTVGSQLGEVRLSRTGKSNTERLVSLLQRLPPGGVEDEIWFDGSGALFVERRSLVAMLYGAGAHASFPRRRSLCFGGAALRGLGLVAEQPAAVDGVERAVESGAVQAQLVGTSSNAAAGL